MAMKLLNASTYAALVAWQEQHYYMPSIRDLAKVLGIGETASYARLLKLEDEGLLEWPTNAQGKRIPRTMRLIPRKEGDA